MESFLEVLVQDVEEAVRETPHEEEDSDERYLARSIWCAIESGFRRTGMMDCLVVISPAPVTAWSSTLFFCVALSMTSTAEGRRSVLLSLDKSLLPKLDQPILCVMIDLRQRRKYRSK